MGRVLTNSPMWCTALFPRLHKVMMVCCSGRLDADDASPAVVTAARVCQGGPEASYAKEDQKPHMPRSEHGIGLSTAAGFRITKGTMAVMESFAWGPIDAAFLSCFAW